MEYTYAVHIGLPEHHGFYVRQGHLGPPRNVRGSFVHQRAHAASRPLATSQPSMLLGAQLIIIQVRARNT